MEVQLTPGQEALVREAVESGRLRTAGDAAQEAFQLWEDRERRRLDIVKALERAEADFASGNFTTCTGETLPQFFEEVKREARALRSPKR
jgi:Arc/MetJ-type ribon-helix-helix transcriptional regulator